MNLNLKNVGIPTSRYWNGDSLSSLGQAGALTQHTGRVYDRLPATATPTGAAHHIRTGADGLLQGAPQTSQPYWDTGLMKGSDLLEHKGQKTHHASAVTVVAHRHLSAGFAGTSVTSRAGVFNVHTQVFICTYRCL